MGAKQAKQGKSRGVRQEPYRHIPVLVMRLSNRLGTAIERRLKTLGMTQSQWAVLATMHSGLAGTASALSHVLGLDPGAVSRLLGRLEHKGLVKRTEATDDRRVYMVNVTPAGARLIPKLNDAAQAEEQAFLCGLTAAERRLLRDLLENSLVPHELSE